MVIGDMKECMIWCFWQVFGVRKNSYIRHDIDYACMGLFSSS